MFGIDFMMWKWNRGIISRFFAWKHPLHQRLLWQAKCSNIQLIQFYIQLCTFYSTMSLIFNFHSTSNVLFCIQLITWYSIMYLTSNCLFDIQLFIQHSNTHLAFNYSFNIQLFIQSISVEPSLFLFSGLISKQVT